MSDCLFRYSTKADIVPLTELWQEVFGDGPELIGAYFRLLWKPGYCVVAEQDSHIEAMGHCLRGPAASGLDCAYIYAMATRAERRGRGLAAEIGRRLIDGAFREGADVVATLPADDGLCGWYEARLGMAPLFRKGGAGVEFPAEWYEFARICGGHTDGTPDTLRAISRPGIEIRPLRTLGWECTFD